MRMSSSLPLTAADICNEWSEEVIRKVLVELGDEDWRVAGKIAGSIVERRPLKTTGDLVDAINNVVPKWSKKVREKERERES
jgi:16S rRNA (cytosine1402-N4)-methyltransferase